MDNRAPAKEYIKNPKKYVIVGFVLVLILAALFYKTGYLPIVGKCIANEKIEQYPKFIIQATLQTPNIILKAGCMNP